MKKFKRLPSGPTVHMLKDRKGDVTITRCGMTVSYNKMINQGGLTVWSDLISCSDCLARKTST